ncbi:MAG: hypothetical protein MJ002_05715 [Paludibacteraceae bacterium]|nr:hypothetical protein [Paludibacteraceae bacterium]
MKRLNLNNAIATTAMLTKTNTMKNKMNFFAKVVMLVAMMVALPYKSLYADEYIDKTCLNNPVYNGTTWYSLYVFDDQNLKKNDDRKPYVFPPTNGTLTFEYRGTNGTSSSLSSRTLSVYDLIGNNDWQPCNPASKTFSQSDNYSTYSGTCRENVVQLSMKITSTGSSGAYQHRVKNIKIPLKRHLHLYNATPDGSIGVTSTSRNFGNTIKIGSTDEATINIRSFLTTTNLKMKVIQATGDAQSMTDVKDVFKIRYLNQVYNGEVTITSTANVCGYPGATGNNTSSSNQATPINTSSIPVVIEYHPNEALSRKARLIFYDGSETNVLAYVDLEGTGVKKTPTFNWKVTDMALDDAAKSISDIVEMTQIDATGAITIVETNQDGSTPPTSPKLSIANGQVSVLEDVPTGVTYLKASYDGNSTYESATSGPQEFTISQNQLQERNIYWTADFTGLRDNQGTIDLTISPWKATTDPNNGNVDDYIVDDPSIASVSDDKTTLTIHKEGITTITAIKNADATYKKATMTKTLVVSSSSGCTKYWINASPNTTSDYTCPSFNGRPREVVWTIETNDYDHSIGTVYLQTVNGQTIKTETTARNKKNVYRTPITGNDTTLRQFKVTGLKGWEAFNYGKRTLIGFQVVMASYLDEIPNNYIAFGEYDNFSTKPLTNKSIAYYQNIPGNISVEVVDVDEGSNNTWDCFTFPNGSRELSITGGCENKGTATINLNFTPKQVGEHKARLKVSAYDGNSDEPVTFYIPITGSGRKITQTLTWNNNPTHPIFTGTYHALSNDVILTDAAKTSGVTTSVGGALTVEYSSSDNTVAEVKKDANGIQYIDFKKAGTFKLRANCEGNAVYSDAAQIESGDITVSLATPNLTISGNTTPEVFSTFQVSASSTGTTSEGYNGASDGKIQFTIDQDANTHATISNYSEANKSCDVTVSSRETETGVPVKVVAHLAETDIYEAKTETLTVTATKIDPKFNWTDSDFSNLKYGDNKTVTVNYDYQSQLNAQGTVPTITYSADKNVSFAQEAVGTFHVDKAGTTTINVHLAPTLNSNEVSSDISVTTYLNTRDAINSWTGIGQETKDLEYFTLTDRIDDVVGSVSVTCDNTREFTTRIEDGKLMADFHPVNDDWRTANCTITFNGRTYYCVISARAQNDQRNYGAIECYRYSESVSYPLAFIASSGNPVIIKTTSNGNHYQFSIDNTNWTRGNNGGDEAVLTITDPNINYFYVRFAPTDAWRNSSDVIADKSSEIIEIQGTEQCVMRIVGSPLQSTLELTTTQVIPALTNMSANIPLDKMLFTIQMANPETSLNPLLYNTDANKSSITFMSTDISVVEINQNDELVVKGPGTATVIATLAENPTQYLTATYDFPISVTYVGLESFGDVYMGNASETQSLNFNDIPGDLTVTSTNAAIFRIYKGDEDGSILHSDGLTFTSDEDKTVFVKFVPNNDIDAVTPNVNETITVTNGTLTYHYNATGKVLRREIRFTTNPLGTIETKNVTLENMMMGDGFTLSINNNYGQVYRINNNPGDSIDIKDNNFDIVFIAKQATTYNGITLWLTEKSTEKTYSIYLYGEATANSQMNFAQIEVSEISTNEETFQISGFDSSIFEIDVVDNGVSVINSFLIDGYHNKAIPTDGTHTVKFHPNICSNFPNTQIVAYDKIHGIAYPITTIKASSRQKEVTLRWIDASNPIIIGATCKSGFAECVEVPSLTVYYNVDDHSIIEQCDEDPANPGYFRGVKGVALSSTNVTATIKETNEYKLVQGGELTKLFEVSSKKGQYIDFPLNELVFTTTSSPYTLAATAKDNITNEPTGLAIDFSLENATLVSDIVTLTNGVLTVNGEGVATLIINAEGNSEYESSVRYINIHVYAEGSCNPIAGSTQERKTEGFVSVIPLNKPIGQFDKLTISLANCAPDLTISILRKDGTTRNIVNTDFGWLVGRRQTYEIFTADGSYIQEDEEDAQSITVDLHGSITSIATVDFPVVNVRQKKYFRESKTPSVVFDNSIEHLFSDTKNNVEATPYSAIDGIIEYTITGPQASSFSIQNPEVLSSITCGDWEVPKLNIKFTPQIVGHCEATLTLKARIDGKETSKNIHLEGTGKARSQTIDWNQDLNALSVADRHHDIELTASSSIKNEILPISYEITNLEDDGITPTSEEHAQLVNDGTGKTYLRVIGSGWCRVKAIQVGVLHGDTFYINPAEAEMTFRIAKANQLINWDDKAGEWGDNNEIITNTKLFTETIDLNAISKYMGSDNVLYNTGLMTRYEQELSGNCSGKDLVTFELNGDETNYVVRYAGNGGGTAVIKAYQDGGDDFEAATSHPYRTLIINPCTPSNLIWDASNLADFHYGDRRMLNTPSSDYSVDGITTYSYSSDNTYVIINGVMIDAIKANASNININATQDAIPCYNYAVTTSPSTFTIAKSDQKIVWEDGFGPIDAGNYTQPLSLPLAYSIDTRHSEGYGGVATYLVRETNGEVKTHLPITYTYTFTPDDPSCQNALQCDIQDNNLIITNAVAGTITVTANCTDANGNYNPATEVTKNITIQRITPTVTATIGTEGVITYNANNTYQIGVRANSDNYVTTNPNDFEYKVVTGGDVITVNNENVTTLKSGTATIEVKKKKDCICEEATCTLSVTVERADRTITITNDLSNVPTNTAPIPLAVSVSEQATGEVINPIYTVTVGMEYIDVTGGVLSIVKFANGVTCTIQAKIAQTDQYNSCSTTKNVTMDNIPLTFDITSIADITDFNSASYKKPGFFGDVMSKWQIECNYNDAVFTLDNCSTNVAEINGDSFTGYEVGTLNISVTASSPRTTTTANDTYIINVPRGTFLFNTAGNWNEKDKWHRSDILPNTNHNVQINATCIIPSDFAAEVYGMTNTLPENLVLDASEDNSATLVFYEGNPDATIRMYFKGHTNEIYGGGYKNPDWQYRGFIGNYTNDSWDNYVVVYKWVETQAAQNQSRWVPAAKSDYKPWAGLCMANMTDQPAYYQYKTKLLPIVRANDPVDSLHLFRLTYSSTQLDNTQDSMSTSAGVNIVTNSFSAPLRVSQLEFTNMNQQVFFFKNNHYLKWRKEKGTSYVACPSQTCEAVNGNDIIPAGHGFLVQADSRGGSTISIPEGAVVKNQASGAYYAPAEKKKFNILSIRLASDSIDDDLFLLESDECTKKYDNGYDGLKMFADGLPQIYATNKYGKTSINADSSMLGQFIGFYGIPELTDYELEFDIDRLEGFTELYLFDHKTKHYANILGGGTYRFTAVAGYDPERFQIMGRRDDGTYFTGEDQWIEVVGQQALLHGFDNEDEMVYIIDLMGNRVWSSNSKNGPWFTLPDLPSGMYVIYCGKARAKFVVK